MATVPTVSDTPPKTHVAMVRRLARLRGRLERANEQVRQLEAARTQLYVEARELDPPMTFKAIADVFGVTEAAVMQKVTRAARAAEAGR